jgi:hypothetical protein
MDELRKVEAEIELTEKELVDLSEIATQHLGARAKIT